MRRSSSQLPSSPVLVGVMHTAAMAVLGAGAVAAASSYRPSIPEVTKAPQVIVAPRPSTSAAPVKVLRPLPITDEMRRKGIHECNPPDPLGLGPYAPYRHVSQGRIAIPQQGGHTEDLSFDVWVHFHGADPVRKTVVQVARGVAYVAIDKGVGSGPYADAFLLKDRWPKLKATITNALVEHTGDERAHIRHIGLSAWSAGYGAVNQIVKQDADHIDAVVLLDGLHGSWKFGTTERDHARITAVDLGYIAPIVEYARRAQRGEKVFVLTHSRIDPELYPGVGITADAILKQLGERRTKTSLASGILTQVGAVDTRGLHVWSFDGRNEQTHCAHISLIARALTDIVEPAWKTPAMDRDVPPTPAPQLGGGGPAAGAGGAATVSEMVAASGAPAANAADAEPVGSAQPNPPVDTGGLTSRPLAPPPSPPKKAAVPQPADPTDG